MGLVFEPMRALTPKEARVVAVLIEKQATVPDAYPLSINALTSGCNQKTARDPAMTLSETDVLRAVDDLKALSLVIESSGSRVSRYEHNLPKVLGVPSQSSALLATLMLRGPQTAAELRLNAERLHRFADISSVDAFLDELANKSPALVVRLPRGAGEREARWAHRLTVQSSALPPEPLSAVPMASAEVSMPTLAPQAALGASNRFELPAHKRLVHTLVIPMRWGDMDAMGHLNNAMYFRLFETLRLDWATQHHMAATPSGEGPVMVNAFINYMKQLVYPCNVVARHYVANPGRTSFDTYFEFEREDQPGVVCANGGAKLVWYDAVSQQPRPLPQRVLSLF
jgi:uncharacterized protein